MFPGWAGKVISTGGNSHERSFVRWADCACIGERRKYWRRPDEILSVVQAWLKMVRGGLLTV